MLLLCLVTGTLSAFLDNVTTILLIAPVHHFSPAHTPNTNLQNITNHHHHHHPIYSQVPFSVQPALCAD